MLAELLGGVDETGETLHQRLVNLPAGEQKQR